MFCLHMTTPTGVSSVLIFMSVVRLLFTKQPTHVCIFVSTIMGEGTDLKKIIIIFAEDDVQCMCIPCVGY